MDSGVQRIGKRKGGPARALVTLGTKALAGGRRGVPSGRTSHRISR